MKTTETATFIGGPLHGTICIPPGTSRKEWADYLTDDGSLLLADTGNVEEQLISTGRQPTRFYRHVEHEDRHLYVHLSVYSRWLLAKNKNDLDLYATPWRKATHDRDLREMRIYLNAIETELASTGVDRRRRPRLNDELERVTDLISKSYPAHPAHQGE